MLVLYLVLWVWNLWLYSLLSCPSIFPVPSMRPPVYSNNHYLVWSFRVSSLPVKDVFSMALRSLVKIFFYPCLPPHILNILSTFSNTHFLMETVIKLARSYQQYISNSLTHKFYYNVGSTCSTLKNIFTKWAVNIRQENVTTADSPDRGLGFLRRGIMKIAGS